MDDPFTNVTWKYLSISDIRRLCATSTQMKTICDDPETWRYLLYRDYTINSTSSDPKREYHREELRERIRPNIRDYLRRNYNINIKENDYLSLFRAARYLIGEDAKEHSRYLSVLNSSALNNNLILDYITDLIVRREV
jgi:hypothetical protein